MIKQNPTVDKRRYRVDLKKIKRRNQSTYHYGNHQFTKEGRKRGRKEEGTYKTIRKQLIR